MCWAAGKAFYEAVPSRMRSKAWYSSSHSRHSSRCWRRSGLRRVTSSPRWLASAYSSTNAKTSSHDSSSLWVCSNDLSSLISTCSDSSGSLRQRLNCFWKKFLMFIRAMGLTWVLIYFLPLFECCKHLADLQPLVLQALLQPQAGVMQ